jgi:hypothetical protein
VICVALEENSRAVDKLSSVHGPVPYTRRGGGPSGNGGSFRQHWINGYKSVKTLTVMET